MTHESTNSSCTQALVPVAPIGAIRRLVPVAPIGAMRRWLLSTAAIALTSGCIGGARPITLPADTVPLQIEEKTFDSGLRVVVERSSTVLSLTTTVAIADQLARYWVFGWEPSKAEHYPELVSQTTISQFMEQLET
ncbi:MAG TPA: hypothetical protein VKP30_06670, partial [Polyangiaceae bacterium]|nr:hypothetical protein [Polyangiaceae bacterium]